MTTSNNINNCLKTMNDQISVALKCKTRQKNKFEKIKR